jgi:N-acetylglutamate synthase-like GNAT family acetyltransferase
MNEITIITDSGKINPQQVQQLLTDCFWCEGVPVEVVSRFLRYSFCVAALHNETVIGFSRVVTDYTTYAYITDVIVCETMRGKGVARKMMNTILQNPELQGLKHWSLISTPESEFLYRSLGFERDVSGECHMGICNLDIYKKYKSIVDVNHCN